MKSEILHLDQLIKRLQEEGVDQAKEMASEILQGAEAQANEIIKGAEEEAERTIQQAQASILAKEQALKDRLRILGRDLLLLTRQKLLEAFGEFLRRSLKEEIQPDFLKQCLASMAEEIKPGQRVALILDESTSPKLAQQLVADFGKSLNREVQARSKKGLEAGFQVLIEEENRYFDFSLQHLSELFQDQLSGQLKEIFSDFEAEENP